MTELSKFADSEKFGELVVVTGMTGAGRSTAAKELEDLGFFVTDNLPPELVQHLVAMIDVSLGIEQPIAVVVDVRSGQFFESLQMFLDQIGTTTKRNTSVLFLDGADEVLVRRQEAARRPHPLQGTGPLLAGIVREREVMSAMRADADLVIDTTELNVHQLKRRVADAFGAPENLTLQITVTSFGFKYGVPVDADLMADMRFLPNPYWLPELREHTGQDAAVSAYVLGHDEATLFLNRYVSLIEVLVDGYLREGKRFMTVGIGCTGGKHRSVAMTEALVSRLNEVGLAASARHRDLGRE